MVDGEVPSDRCGYAYDVSTLVDVGAMVCWRPVWDDADRCIWHADRDAKPREAVEDAKLDCPERLDGAVLKRMSLNGVDWFEESVFIGAELTAIDLHDASLTAADLREASLRHVDARRADLSRVDLEDATVNVCDFRDADLSDVRFDQSVFTNVRISRGTAFGETTVYEDEIAESDDGDYLRSAQAAIWSYREIRNLHESNALPIEARHYHLEEKDMRRRVDWHEGNYGQALMSEGSRWATGYGMSPWRVLAVSAAVIVLSALLYPLTGGIQETATAGETNTWTLENPEDAPAYFVFFVFAKSLYFSTITFSTLGYGDIRPIGSVARAIAGVESVLGSLLMALLVFVLTRRIS